jgi:hypothetical protein
MDDDRPASKKDFEELKVDMGCMEERLTEKMRDMQTELLRAFGPVQEVVNLRMRNVEANTSNDLTAV